MDDQEFFERAAIQCMATLVKDPPKMAPHNQPMNPAQLAEWASNYAEALLDVRKKVIQRRFPQT